MPSCSPLAAFIRTVPFLQRCSAALLMSAVPLSTLAGQLDIVGPPGSGLFGNQVLALPNGNFAVSDSYTSNVSPSPGAVYLYRPDGTLISKLVGSDPGDRVGEELKSLGNGNFVVISPNWNQHRGAVTFVNGTTGLSGAVSAANSLVGSQENDSVGAAYIDTIFFGIIALSHNLTVVGSSNYVVVSNHWQDGSKFDAGAVTWCSGTTGCTGPVSIANSLIGGTAGDVVGQGGLQLLENGNYVVLSNGWDDPAGASNAGAITWASGSSGIAGLVSPANSLVGTHAGDLDTAYVVPLSNGNYVTAMQYWDNGAWSDAGAVAWGNGTTPATGTISPANAYTGSHDDDWVGLSVTPLSNGHYVVCSPFLDAGSIEDIGAATWGNGNTGLTGVASPIASLAGPASGKGPRRVIALRNGNYVVVSPDWDAGGAPAVGAVTWANGNAATWASVSAANSLVGSSVNDRIGTSVVALDNGNYVVGSPDWDGVDEDTGAATWANGSTGLVGTVSAANSLVGTMAVDHVGAEVTALRNGHYVVVSASWDNGSLVDAGAATWGDGATGLVGTPSAANSLVGATTYEYTGGCGATALSNGNYVVCSQATHLAGLYSGSVTWGNGSGGTVGTVTPGNSLYGNHANDRLGSSGISAMADGNYVIRSFFWNGGFGAFTLGSGTGSVAGPVSSANSVLGTNPESFSWTDFDYNAAHHQLVIGRPTEHVVTLFTLDADAIFADGFEGK